MTRPIITDLSEAAFLIFGFVLIGVMIGCAI